MNYKLDTEKQIFFYEQEFYVLSNFSSFAIEFDEKLFPTSEHAYHYFKFNDENIKNLILNARSAHDAFKIAREHSKYVIDIWNSIKVPLMKEILLAKVNQHPYVKKKLLETGDRELIEDSWRDDYWGWGPDKNGQNILGKIWMKIRDEIKQQES